MFVGGWLVADFQRCRSWRIREGLRYALGWVGLLFCVGGGGVRAGGGGGAGGNLRVLVVVDSWHVLEVFLWLE